MPMVEVVEVHAGEDLIAAISRVKDAGGVWVQAVGKVDGAEISTAGAVSEEPRTLAGRVTLVSLAGPVGGPYGVVLAAGASTVVAGFLQRARSAGVMLAVHGAEGLDAALAEMGRARSATERASSIPPPPVVSGGLGSLYAAVTDHGNASRPEPPGGHAEEEESDLMPEFKDRVIHPVFGLCDVMVVKGERLKIRDVNGPHRLREIHLSVMKVLPPVEREGVRVFRLVKRD